MQIHRPRADRAPAGQRDLCFAEPRNKRAEHKDGCPHSAHQIVWGDRIVDPAGIECHRHAALGVFDLGHRNAVLFEQFRHGRNIGEPRQVGERQRLGAQQAGSHKRQCRVFRAADADFTGKPVSALYDDLVHADMPTRPRLFYDGARMSLNLKCLAVALLCEGYISSPPGVYQQVYRSCPSSSGDQHSGSGPSRPRDWSLRRRRFARAGGGLARWLLSGVFGCFGHTDFIS